MATIKYHVELNHTTNQLQAVDKIELNKKCECKYSYPCVTSKALGSEPSTVEILFPDYKYTTAYTEIFRPVTAYGSHETDVHVCATKHKPMAVISEHLQDLSQTHMANKKYYKHITINVQEYKYNYTKKIQVLPMKIEIEGKEINDTTNFNIPENLNKTYTLNGSFVQNMENNNNTKYKDHPEYFNYSTIIDRILINITSTYTTTITSTILSSIASHIRKKRDIFNTQQIKENINYKKLDNHNRTQTYMFNTTMLFIPIIILFSICYALFINVFSYYKHTNTIQNKKNIKNKHTKS